MDPVTGPALPPPSSLPIRWSVYKGQGYRGLASMVSPSSPFSSRSDLFLCLVHLAVRSLPLNTTFSFFLTELSFQLLLPLFKRNRSGFFFPNQLDGSGQRVMPLGLLVLMEHTPTGTFYVVRLILLCLTASGAPMAAYPSLY